MIPTEARPRILVVDDEEAIRSALVTLLTRAGFSAQVASSGPEALVAIRDSPPDLILLDVVLDEANPQAESGLNVLRVIRVLERFIPVIMLTSYTEWQLESLGQGAIAFVTKPWDANALILQIRATLNAIAQVRKEATVPAESPTNTLTAGDVHIDLNRYRVSRAGREVDLTPIEFALLTFLVRTPHREWSREQLLNQVWGYDWVGYERTVDRHIAALRRKLRLDRDELIETVHGTGYRLVLP
ncbi:MAG TPA: response regulator transcription factor [Aggregatilineales bacterium]|jgi:DNA-binding response OmpR family regulator|nr:response regulator transcription factor [Aggregatilineales bacterium]